MDSLGKFLARVVGEEGDMRKAVGVVKWFAWVVGDVDVDVDIDGDGGEVSEMWDDAVERVKAVVVRAARVRGLGVVNFD